MVTKAADRTTKLEQQVAQLMADRGIAVNPVDAAVKAMVAHVQARQEANPQFDFSELLDQLNRLDTENVTSGQANLIRAMVTRELKTKSQIAHEMGYIDTLADDLVVEVLKNENADNEPEVPAES